MPQIEYDITIEEIGGSGMKFEVETGYLVNAAKRSNVITLHGSSQLEIPVYYLLAYGSDYLQEKFGDFAELKEKSMGHINLTIEGMKEIVSIKKRLDKQ